MHGKPCNAGRPTRRLARPAARTARDARLTALRVRGPGCPPLCTLTVWVCRPHPVRMRYEGLESATGEVLSGADAPEQRKHKGATRNHSATGGDANGRFAGSSVVSPRPSWNHPLQTTRRLGARRRLTRLLPCESRMAVECVPLLGWAAPINHQGDSARKPAPPA